MHVPDGLRVERDEAHAVVLPRWHERMVAYESVIRALPSAGALRAQNMGE